MHLHHLQVWGLPRRTNNPVRDYVCIPLCPRCHLDGRHAIHAIGQANWFELHGLTPEQVLLQQYVTYASWTDLPLPASLSASDTARWLRSQEG